MAGLMDKAMVRVSPAQAGMDLFVMKVLLRFGSFPRTGGDGPHHVTGAASGAQFPPHRRGWTRHACAGRRVEYVSPAQAGMDPYRPSNGRDSEGFPRTGGDGPPKRKARATA